MRAVEDIEPSPEFRRELRARLAAAVRNAGREPGLTPAGFAAAVLVAVAGVLLVYEGLAARREKQLARERRAMPMVVVNPRVPFVTFTRADALPPAGLVVPTSTGADAAIAP